MEQWQIERTAGICAGTGRKLEPGEEYYAALIDRGADFERRDYSVAYWQQQPPQVFSYWRTRMPLASHKRSIFVDNDVLCNLFERLADETEPLKVHFRFVLALILMRKRLLKYEESCRAGDREVWRLRLVRDPRLHEVVNPDLDDEQIQQVAQQLSAILQGEL